MHILVSTRYSKKNNADDETEQTPGWVQNPESESDFLEPVMCVFK